VESHIYLAYNEINVGINTIKNNENL